MATCSTSDAERLARDLFGLHGTAQRLPGEYDDNFHLRCDDRAQFVVKIVHSGQPRAIVEMQCAALLYLAQHSPALALPRIHPSLDGMPLATTQLAGEQRLLWVLQYLPGRVMADAKPQTDALLDSLGALLGRLDAALAGFDHTAADRELKWDLSRAGWIRAHLNAISEPTQRQLVTRALERYEAEVVPALGGLRTSIIHGDANDYNVLVDGIGDQCRVVSLIDFGDMLRCPTVCEPAIAAAYALLGKADPLAAAAAVIAGYHAEYPLSEAEIALLFPLIVMRLAVSVTNSALRKTLEPDDPYLTISEAPAWAALEQLDRIQPPFAHYVFRHACGLPPVPHATAVCDWLAAQRGSFAEVLPGVQHAPTLVFDLSVGSLFLGADPAAAETGALSRRIVAAMDDAGVAFGIGRYDEARLIYTSDNFASGAHATDERRTIHLGIDLFVPADTPMFAPLAGTVVCTANNAARLDYGPLLILEHRTSDGLPFFTLYGHLAAESLERSPVGRRVAAGERLGSIGAPPINGDWPPHLHFQIILDLLGLGRDFPGVAYASQRDLWRALSPDANLILGIASEAFPPPEPTKGETLAARRVRLGGNLSISYREPLKIVRGWRQHLYDETGRAYLDVYNNVPLVGHSHPRIVAAAQAQLGLLNTNTRYLHDTILCYAERLTALMPEPLRVCFFLNSASEANELALRLARAYTGQRDTIVLDAAYHGHTTTLVDISPYKFNGPGGTGQRPWVHIAPIADDYRGPYRRDDPQAGTKYAAHVAELLAGIAPPRNIAAFIAESLPSVGGQIVFPEGYLAAAYQHVRARGGVCIADEVQVGFGRLGSHTWGFETQGVIPDIVVLGKPIGNGFPLAAVVTTAAIADSFDNGMEFFSTFGGNPVACAAGLAVLDVLRDEQLQANALRVGNQLLAGMREIVERHPLVGDARGSGLFLGLELVRDRTTLEPADHEASYLVNRMRQCGILAGTDGPYHNVIKLRPPLCFTEQDAIFLLETLDRLFQEDALQYHG